MKTYIYTQDDLKKAIRKFLFGGRYDFGRKNDVESNDTFKRLGFDNIILTQFLIDFKQELNVPVHYILHADIKMKIGNFIRTNTKVLNYQLFKEQE